MSTGHFLFVGGPFDGTFQHVPDGRRDWRLSDGNIIFNYERTDLHGSLRSTVGQWVFTYGMPSDMSIINAHLKAIEQMRAIKLNRV